MSMSVSFVREARGGGGGDGAGARSKPCLDLADVCRG
jgi:hypothetical protein